jgi:F-type H+-transporting ATPase subunit delta
MPSTAHYSPTAVSYAQSLLELAGDQAASIGEELRGLRQIVDTNPTFKAFLADPSIGELERKGVLERTLKGKVAPLLWNFMGVLNDNGRLGVLDEIAGAFDDLLDEKLGKVEVDITVAQPLTQDQLAAAQKKISAALGKEAVIHVYVDDAIIGGMVVRVADKLLDASVRYQLQAMKEQLLSKIPK